MLHVWCSALKEFQDKRNKGKPLVSDLWGKAQPVKTDKHNSLGTKPSLLPPETGSPTGNVGCCLQDHLCAGEEVGATR